MAKTQLLDGHLSIDTLSITPTTTTQNQNEVTVSYRVDGSTQLNYPTPQDVPKLKAEIAFQADTPLDSAQAFYVQAKIQKDTALLQSYIVSPNPFSEDLTATGSLASDGSIIPGTVNVYFVDDQGNSIPATQVINDMPTASTVEASTQEGLANVVSHFTHSISASTLSSSSSGGLYEGEQAQVLYVNSYTDNTSTECAGGTNPTYQDQSYWNPAYEHIWCNDCANYASQGLYDGGLYLNSTWEPYTSDWVGAQGLNTYLISLGSTPESYSAASAGDMVFLGTPGSFYHAMTVTYDDGTNVRESAHTSDRKDISDFSPSWSVAHFYNTFLISLG